MTSPNKISEEEQTHCIRCPDKGLITRKGVTLPTDSRSGLNAMEYLQVRGSSNRNSKGGRILKNLPRTSTSGAVRVQNMDRKFSKMLNAPSALSCQCNVSCASPRELRLHMRTCDKMHCCGRQYNDVSILRRHLEVTHNGSAPISEQSSYLACKFCGVSNFLSPRGRDQHLRIHCKKNPSSSWSKNRSNENTTSTPPLRKDRSNNHSVPFTSDFS